MKKILLNVLVFTLFFSCSKNETTIPKVEVNDSFNTSITGWTGGFADYPVGSESFYELSFAQSNLPTPLDVTKKGIKISGNNHSDDLFMYLTKKVSGLKPNQKYVATFDIELASNAASNSFGVGGSPAESVYFGVGLTATEPKKIVESSSNHYRMNFKKMQQAGDGEEMKVFGNIGNGTEKSEYKLIKKIGSFTGTSDAQGNIWLVVGTDSGFEATTTLYYTSIKATFEAVVK
jgi:hypothetical protein